MKSMYDYNRFDLLQHSPQLIRFRKAARIRVMRTPRLLLVKLKVVSRKRNLQRGDNNNNNNATTTTTRNPRKCRRIGSVLCSKKLKAVAEVANSGARKINRLLSRTKNQDNNLLSRISGMFIRIKKRTGFSLSKWKIISSKSSCIKIIPSRHIPRGYMQIHSRKFMKKKVRKAEEEIELCKKRILMGEKCKPLNISGSLHYDQNGVLLPEELVLPCE